MKGRDLTRQSAEAAFVALQGVRGLQQSSEHRPVLLGELVHYLQGHVAVDDGRIREQLKAQLSLRRQFNQLLNDLRVATAPRQAQAASAGLLNARETRAFSLKFKVSRAHPDQVYVLLAVLGEACMADGRQPVLIASKDSDIVRLCFPVLNDHSAQALLLADDERLILLRDPDAELSLV